MVTGDNINTAVSVASNCDMVRANERIVMVNAYADPDNVPRVNFTLLDDYLNHLERQNGFLPEQSNGSVQEIRIDVDRP